MIRRWLHAATIVAIVLATVGAPALALCATDGKGCCCGSSGAVPPPCRDGLPAGASAVCCAPSTPTPEPTAAGPERPATSESCEPQPAVVAATPALPTRATIAGPTARTVPPPDELFTLHAAWLI